jgi:hypothetical protein
MNVSSLKKFSAALRQIPRVVAQQVATGSAPAITKEAQVTFNAGQDPYGVAWLPGVDGRPVTLEQTGALKRQVRYVAIGTKLRVALGVPYAKYQIGRRLVFPRQGGVLPSSYANTLTTVAQAVLRKEFSQ